MLAAGLAAVRCGKVDNLLNGIYLIGSEGKLLVELPMLWQELGAYSQHASIESRI